MSTENMSAGEVLAVIDTAIAALAICAPEADNASSSELSRARAAVAALIARNAEMEAQTPSALREKLRSCEEALATAEADNKALRELASASQVLIEEWDRNDANKFDIMPAKDWERAEARFRAAIKAARAEAGHG